MDFSTDLKAIVAGELTRLGIKFDATADVERLLLLICNHEFKSIKPSRRDVRTSAEFEAELKKLSSTEQAAATAIQQKFAQGNDVNGHLSRGSDATRAGDVDQLLADWGIYHLHISNHKDDPTDKFFARTGPVMFAHVTPTEVYFIDIYRHGGWTRQKLLEIVERTWPQLYEGSRLNGVTDVSFLPTDADIKTFRGRPTRNGRPGTDAINSILKVGNSFLAPPGGGLATDGTPNICVMRTDKTLHLVRGLEELTSQMTSRWKGIISQRNYVPESELDFELVPLSPPGFGIREKKTGTMVYVTPEK